MAEQPGVPGHRVRKQKAKNMSNKLLSIALAAGLGVACLNESALAEGVGLLAPPHGLPALPRVDFHLLAARRGEAELVTRVRELLAQELR